MLYSVGRLLQAIGLFVILPAAIVGNAIDRLELSSMLKLTAAGMILFTIGWLLQQAGKKK